MGVASPVFLATTVCAALAIRFLGALVPRDVVFIAAGVAFVFAMSGDAVATLPFWALVSGGYVVVRNAHRAARPMALLALAVLVVLAWWWLRTMAPAALGVDPGGAAVFGLSYAMFRIIHLTIDARDGELGRPLGWRTYLCYLTFFPNYLAGPVQRFQHFAPQLAFPARQIGTADWIAAGRRVVAGLFKCTALAGVALSLHQMGVAAAIDNPPAPMAAALLCGAALSYAAYLYFSFAGYMDVVIGAGRVLGVDIPENFDAPLRARNFLDIWSRWHITVSEWFRFYVFNPFLKTLLETFTRPSLAPYLGAVGYFLAFFLMGLWHGRTPALVVYGLALGAGVSLNKLFQVWSTRRLGRRAYAALCARAGYQLFAQALAMAYFVLALGFLWQRAPEILAVGNASMAGAALLTFAACAMLAAGVRLFGTDRAAPSPGLAGVIAAGQAMGCAAYLWLLDGAVPELIYQRL